METSETQQYAGPVKIDLNDPTAILPDDELVMDPDAEAFQTSSLVPDGDHIVKLSLGSRGVTSIKMKNGGNFIKVHVNGKIVAPGESLDGRMVFDDVTTLVSEFTGTSRMAGVMAACGETIPARTSLDNFAKAFVAVLGTEPLVKVTTQWQAAEKGENGKYKVFLRGMKRFPQTSTGAFKHIVPGPSGAPVTARASIVRYFSAKD